MGDRSYSYLLMSISGRRNYLIERSLMKGGCGTVGYACATIYMYDVYSFRELISHKA